MAAEWRRRRVERRRHFKEKMSGGREREGARNFVPQKRSEL